MVSTATAGRQVMLFVAGEAAFGISLDAVVRVLSESKVTPIPRMVSEVLGATLFEGLAVPVFDMEERKNVTDKKRLILMVQFENNDMGIAVDNVLRIVSSEDEELTNGIEFGLLEGMPFKLVTPEELIPSGLRGPGGGENDEENPAGR